MQQRSMLPHRGHPLIIALVLGTLWLVLPRGDGTAVPRSVRFSEPAGLRTAVVPIPLPVDGPAEDGHFFEYPPLRVVLFQTWLEEPQGTVDRPRPRYFGLEDGRAVPPPSHDVNVLHPRRGAERQLVRLRSRGVVHRAHSVAPSAAVGTPHGGGLQRRGRIGPRVAAVLPLGRGDAKPNSIIVVLFALVLSRSGGHDTAAPVHL
mmetsp:Transcript_22100/g.50514  ORF Transcript_22100/g.50514 Transcript_22100/m.50514 type:complete len:204 (-) Transcript_22100:402-1013(-)